MSRKDTFEIVQLKTGAKSLRELGNRETFHPVVGPVAEAQILHVEQQRLLERSKEKPLLLWDIGLGAAANALTAIRALKESPQKIHITSFDQTLAPLKFALENSADLDYIQGFEKPLEELMHTGSTQIGSISWKLSLGNFCETMHEIQEFPHAIFYDPYSPESNREMWSLKHFASLFPLLKEEFLLTNYTRSTAVRVTLLLAGFFVGIGRAVGEKSETTIASNALHLLENPLGPEWLERVKYSGNAAPLEEKSGQAPINEADYERLCECPQFHFFLR